MMDADVIEQEIRTAMREELIGLARELAGLSALVQIRLQELREDDSEVWVPASAVIPLLDIPRRTLYDRAPRLAWARRKATGKGWEFELSAARKAARKDAA